MSDRGTAEAWFANYRKAWESNEVDDIRSLFTDDAVYRGSPSTATPWEGIDHIVEQWLEHRDEPGDTEFEWKLLAVDGDVAIAQCVSTYLTETPPEVYDNLFVIRLAPDGRATEYTDWWVQRKAPASTGSDA